MLVFYLKQLVWPLQMSELHYFPYVTYLSLRRLILPMALLLALGYGLLRWSRRDRAAGFFWSLMALPILPLLDFRAFGMDEVVHDRYLYIPSAGLCLLLGLAWQRLVPRVTPYHFLAVAAVAGFLSYRTIHESAFWHDDVSLFRHTYDVAPQHVMAPEDLGQVLFLRGELADALPYLERAVAMGTHNREVFFDLGRIHFQNQDWEGAAVLFEQALLGNAKIGRYLFFQGVTDFHRGRLEEAEQEIREAIRARESLVTDFGMPHLALAYVLEKRGDREGALAECMAELHDHPADAEVQQQIRRLRR
jgi:tetratricopeptide (TPR) repeat protein